MVMIMGGIVEIVLFIVLIAWQKYNVYFFLSVLGFVNSIALFCLCCKNENNEKISEENKKETRAQRKEEKKNRKLLKKERKEAFRKKSELLRKGANGDW